MTISSVLLLTLATLIVQTTSGYNQSQRTANHLNQARAFIQLFQAELSTQLPATPIIHGSQTSGGPETSDQIAFIRTLSADEQNPSLPGDLSTSCYYVAFVQESEQRVIPKLLRKILTPQETQLLIESGNAPEFPETDPATDEALIDSVLSFQATPKFMNPTTGNFETWTPSSAQPPSVIELSLRVLDESSSRRFTHAAAWNRLATAQKPNERALIRTFAHSIPIGK